MDNISKREENFEKLTMADNFLFGEVMYDEKTGKDVLEIILGVNIERVVVVDKEKHIDNVPDRKSIRLDVYMKDKKIPFIILKCRWKTKKIFPIEVDIIKG